MMGEKSQFDTFLGGSEELPSQVNVLQLAAARANEIAAMTYSIDNPTQTKLAFQKLPVHMRRRVMSHNSKRMPRRLREVHISQMAKSGLAPSSKRPSRKFRRRPENLQAEYKKRQRDKHWLETHIWHAKRFHMIQEWNFKIPFRSSNRCFRASYRGMAGHCLLQDISYYSCVEISGPIETLRRLLKQHCDPNRLTFGAKCYLSGGREGTLMFYRKNSYPRFPVGSVHFAWRPGTGNFRTVWIWVHPSTYDELLREITSTFSFVESELLDEKLPKFRSTDDNGTSMILLKGSLNRFQLTGPLSLAVIADALQLPNLNSLVGNETPVLERKPDDDVMEVTGSEDDVEITSSLGNTTKNETVKETDTRSWNFKFYADSENVSAFRAQAELFDCLKNLKSPNQLPPSILMGFTVLDPRFSVPRKRIKSVTNDQDMQTIPVPPSVCCSSPVWDVDIRDMATKSYAKSSEIDKLRSQNLIPGIDHDCHFDQSQISKVPIILIQRPGCNRNDKPIGFGSGIDIILPSGWAMAFWLSLILRCARPGGLRESKSVILENLNLNTPDFNAPDTVAWTVEATASKDKLMEKYFRYPPNRRVNFVKLGITSPFYCEWNLLAKEWTGFEAPYVLRDPRLLEELRSAVCLKKSNVDETLFGDSNALVAVKISVEKRGRPKDFSIVSLPTDGDLEKFKTKNRWSGPVEPLHADKNESRRKKLRREHLALLKRLRRRRLRKRNATDNELVKSDLDLSVLTKVLRKKSVECTRNVVEAQAVKMRDLYLPKCTEVRFSCDREVAGYVVKGDFSFSEAKGIGIGYLVLRSIFVLVKKKSDLVLIRNTTTRQYRFAKIEVLT